LQYYSCSTFFDINADVQDKLMQQHSLSKSVYLWSIGLC